jgi:ribose 5-phosphate isomerase
MIKGGGAQAASDKVVQQNGQGTVTIDGFSKQLKVSTQSSSANVSF